MAFSTAASKKNLLPSFCGSSSSGACDYFRILKAADARKDAGWRILLASHDMSGIKR
jgi:hypothetical protein